MIRIVCLFLVFVATSSFAQKQLGMQLKGKVTNELGALEGIYVINKETEKSVTTNKEGYFSIQVNVGDTLLFTASQFTEMKLVLTQNDFKQEFLIVKMKPVVHQLNEVIIRNGINAVSMGIIPQGQRFYTPAERRLNTANNLNASANAGTMMGGSISADPLLNWFSGRTKMLKKDLAVEKKEMYLKQLENMFTNDFYISKLKIPSEYVKGFEYYAVENESFVKILKSNNIGTTTFLIGELAIKYKEIIAGEN